MVTKSGQTDFQTVGGREELCDIEFKYRPCHGFRRHLDE